MTNLTYKHLIENSRQPELIRLKLVEHLNCFGIHSSEVTIQTDNGSEMIGSITAKKDSALTCLVEQVYSGKHKLIPVGQPKYNGHVESFHGRIEEKFYTTEVFSSLSGFLSKAYTFTLYWNLRRKPLKKKAPVELIRQKCQIFNPRVCDFKPWILDEMRTIPDPHYRLKSVPYVRDEVTPRKEAAL